MQFSAQDIEYEESPTYQAFYHSPVSLLSPKKSRSAQATCSLVPRSVRAMRIGFLTFHDGHDNENVKKQIVKISKTTTLHVHHAFLFISLPSLDGKMPNFTFLWRT